MQTPGTRHEVLLQVEGQALDAGVPAGSHQSEGMQPPTHTSDGPLPRGPRYRPPNRERSLIGTRAGQARGFLRDGTERLTASRPETVSRKRRGNGVWGEGWPSGCATAPAAFTPSSWLGLLRWSEGRLSAGYGRTLLSEGSPERWCRRCTGRARGPRRGGPPTPTLTQLLGARTGASPRDSAVSRSCGV